MSGDLGNRLQEWQLPRVLTAPAIENWFATLPATTERVIFRLGTWTRTGPFADARLQSVLCLLHRRNVETIAHVPAITLKGDRATNAFADPHPLQRRTTSTPTERRLAGSIAGLVIGQLCSFGGEHYCIPRLQRETLVRRRYLFGRGRELALAVPTETSPTGMPRRPAFEREAIFNNRLEDLIEPLGVSLRNAQSSTLNWFNALKTFAFEASENTWDHGRLDFDTHPIRSVRFVRLQRINIAGSGFDSSELAPGFEKPFENYLDSLAIAEDLPVRWSRTNGKLVEVTIADGGVGIAAKMAGGFNVFDDSLRTETQYLFNALLPDQTTKSSSEAGRGQGLGKMLQACYRLSGLVVVRTGRLRAWRTYRLLNGSNEQVDFNSSSSSAYAVNVNREALPLIAGTSVSLIFPVALMGGVQKSKHA